ncbi:MAG TPA: hypothetical protein VN207_05085 [Ktedonobacteraceae bacterium]|nr:hypothetical protein [Ktedonobacteraceae bacterium]
MAKKKIGGYPAMDRAQKTRAQLEKKGKHPGGNQNPLRKTH